MPIGKTYQPTKSKKPSVSLADFKNDKSIIIAIQNDVRFINIIMNLFIVLLILVTLYI